MKTFPFDIKYKKKIEDGDLKVLTNFGEPAQIVKWDCKGRYPILAVIDDGDTDDCAFYTIEGKSIGNPNESYLMLTPALSDFENAYISSVQSACINNWDINDKAKIKDICSELISILDKEYPRLKKIPNGLMKQVNLFGENIFLPNGYYIPISDIEKLPKED